MIGAADQPVLVRDVEVPQNSMQEFGTVVGVEKILIADFKVNREP